VLLCLSVVNPQFAHFGHEAEVEVDEDLPIRSQPFKRRRQPGYLHQPCVILYAQLRECGVAVEGQTVELVIAEIKTNQTAAAIESKVAESVVGESQHPQTTMIA
jgi:hypothetical protein